MGKLRAPIVIRAGRGALMVGVTMFFAALFGILTREPGFLAAFWPANALMLGLMIRWPWLGGPMGWLGGIAGFLAADLVTGSDPATSLLLTAANLSHSFTKTCPGFPCTTSSFRNAKTNWSLAHTGAAFTCWT